MEPNMDRVLDRVMDNYYCDDLHIGINFDPCFDHLDDAPPITSSMTVPAPNMVSGSVSFDHQQLVMGGATELCGPLPFMGGANRPEVGGSIIAPPMVTTAMMSGSNLDDNSVFCSRQCNFKATVAKGVVSGRGKQFKFVEKTNTVYVKPKNSVPFCFSTETQLPVGCWVRAKVTFTSDVVTKQQGPVKRCANHISEDVQSGQTINVEHFMQCKLDDARYFKFDDDQCCVDVPYDKLVDGVCLFFFACYNSCLEYKDGSSRRGKLVKPGLRALFTLLDANGYILGEDSVDVRACACPTRDAPSARNCRDKVQPLLCSSGTRTRSSRQVQVRATAVKGVKHKLKKKKCQKKQLQSLESVVCQVQEAERLNKDDEIDSEAGTYKFTCVVNKKEQYQILCTLRAAFQQQQQ